MYNVLNGIPYYHTLSRAILTNIFLCSHILLLFHLHKKTREKELQKKREKQNIFSALHSTLCDNNYLEVIIRQVIAYGKMSNMVKYTLSKICNNFQFKPLLSRA